MVNQMKRKYTFYIQTRHDYKNSIYVSSKFVWKFLHNLKKYFIETPNKVKLSHKILGK